MNIGTGSAGVVIVYISTAIVAGTTSVVLNLGLFDAAKTKQSIEMFCITATPRHIVGMVEDTMAR